MDIQELHSFKLGDAIKFHKELNPKLWQDEKLDPVVRKQLLKIAEDFVEDLGVTLEVKDITVSGSNAAFTYTPHSDLDLHVVVDMTKLPDSDVYKELFNAKKTLYNEANDIKVRGIPVELYVQDAEQPHVSLGEYSVLHDEWLRIPKRQRANFDQHATREKYRQLARLVNLAMKTKDLAKVKKAIDIIRRYRQAGLHDKGEFSPENLAYKAIRKQGGIDKLYNLRNQLHGQSLSIDEAVETKADAIKLINKLKNTSGRSDTEAASFNAKIDELIRQYKISPEDLGMREPVDPIQAKISAAAHKRQQAADLLKTEWERFKRGLFAESEEIDESLDSQPYPYSRTDNSDRSQRYKFVTADNNKYEVALNLDDNTGVAMIGFSLLHHKSDRGNYHYDAGITNTGDARRVFATVIEIIKQFADKYKPQVIAFTANEPSRIRLYDAFMKRLDRALPDYVAADKIPEKEAWYILARKNKKIDEAFDRPYPIKWEKSEFGNSLDALATLDDGTPLSIMFNDEGNDEWQVEFYRDNSQEITGKGDATRVFATVLNAIQQFIKKEQPQCIIFAASKDVEPGRNSQSRSNLYNSLVARYASSWGYDAYEEDHGDQITYELTRKTQDISEASITLYTDPDYFGADVDDAMLQTLPVVNIPLDQLTGYEPEEKMNSPEARANVKRIIAGLKQGAAIPPILVRRWKGDYQVLDGHHRFYAYKLAKKETIPARIVPDDEIETINESSGDIPSPREKNNTPWQFAKPKLDYWMLQEAVQEYCKKDGKWFPHRTHGIHQLVSKPEIRESIEDEVKEFWNQMSRLDGRANVELVPGSLTSVIQCWTHLYDAVFELRGNLAPKKIANVYYEDGGSIGYIEFEDGSTFPDKTFLERGQGGELDGIVTTFFPSKSSAEYMLDVLHLVVPAGWKISTTNLKESALAEASRQIDEIGFSNAPGSLSLSDEQIISNSTKDGTIGSRPVFLYVSGPNRIYFFTRGSKIDAFVYLHNGYLKGMKNLAVNKGLVYNLFQHIINMKGKEIHLGPSDQLTQDGIEWLLGQTKRQTGFKLHDQRGNPIDPDVLFDEWETARETFTPGSTAVTISESKNSIWVRENENLLMPMDTYGATLVEVSPMHSVVEVPDLIEASGYIPSEKEKNDPRWCMALTKDVHPDTMKRAAKGFGWKISRAGIPPQARPNGKI